MTNIYLPHLARIITIQDDTYDTKTFGLELVDAEARNTFRFRPGQFLEIAVLGVGEAPFGLASNPNHPEAFFVTIRAVGSVTDALHKLSPGDIVGVRGPFGNGFPFDEIKGKNVLFVAGGIGLPPLRSLIEPMLDARSEFGDVQILYGARSPADLVYKNRLKEWETMQDVRFMMTVDVGDSGWSGNVGVVTTIFPKADIIVDNTVAFVCGPPIMIRFAIMELLRLGFAPANIISTLERYMKCGVGKCGHCAIGHKYVCLDGPVFSYREMMKLPERVV
ncbi:MAG: FAD/NAD(P)-binding protein [Deltaproteobacteria bacterium]|nr:FAD/NAD(P)-binding protein [Deltaproteobacteria bacterium]